MTADLILLNGDICTMDPALPRATALAVRDDRFLAVGTADDVGHLRAEHTRLIDLDGASVLPGLCDAHIHFTAYALGLRRVDLFEVPSLDELQRRLAQRTQMTPPGTWIVGSGWNQNLWADPRFPDRHDLDTYAPDHPVLLWEKSGHCVVVNSLALRLAGLNETSVAPEGGEIVQDTSGQPIGLLLEDPAIDLVNDLIHESTPVELDEAVLQAQQIAHRFGLTSVHDLDGKQGFESFQRVRLAGKLKLRTVTHVAMAQLEDALGLGLKAGLGDGWLRVGGLKLFADGALGPRTAAMIAPYEGEPDNRGITIVDKEDMVAMASRASVGGLPTVIHAIGDRANHDVLDVFAEVRRLEAEAGIERARRRHRIEHVQLLHPDDLNRLAVLDIIASVQPIHATQDMDNVDAYWGRRGQFAYAFRALLDSGARLALGSDAPVETPNPFIGIHAAVTRRSADGTPGPEGWYPDQRLTVAQALAGYSIGAAYAEGWEKEVGSISAGKYADFVVPDRNIFQCNPMAIKDVKVQWTVVGGQTVFATGAFADESIAEF